MLLVVVFRRVATMGIVGNYGPSSNRQWCKVFVLETNLVAGSDIIICRILSPPPSVISVKINQIVIGWLAVLHNSAHLVHVAGVLRVELN